MAIRISELYGKKVIASSGSVLGDVKGVVIDAAGGAVAYLLLSPMDNLVRSSDLRGDFRKKSVSYDRVTKISEGIVVKSMPAAVQKG
jgi:sporulation protein YlmC with PRC-barrel domain